MNERTALINGELDKTTQGFIVRGHAHEVFVKIWNEPQNKNLGSETRPL